MLLVRNIVLKHIPGSFNFLQIDQTRAWGVRTPIGFLVAIAIPIIFVVDAKQHRYCHNEVDFGESHFFLSLFDKKKQETPQF